MLLETAIDVSVIIVNYNTCTLTMDCINSIIEKAGLNRIEIIVVDNASSDGSAGIIAEKFPAVKLITNSSNLGFGKANNAGAMHATGEFLFLLNSDTVLLNNAIDELLHFMKADASGTTGICGGNLFKANLQPNHSYFNHFPSLLSMVLYRSQTYSLFFGNETFNKSGRPKDVAIIIGADIFIRRSLFIEINGFDPAFFMYVEDGELCLRVKKLGYRIVSVPTAQIVHHQGKSSTTGQKLAMEVASYLHYFKKHHGRLAASVYKLIELFFAVCKYTLFIFNRDKRAAYLKLINFLL